MRIDDVTKLDWKKDKNLLAVQQKLAGLVEREAQDRARLADLEHIVREAERSIVDARAAALLSEKSDESAEVIQERMESARREMVDLRANLDALKLARVRLEPSVTGAMSEAKLRVAAMLVPMYQETTEALRVQLEKAAELNNILHAVHSHTLKQDLRQEIHGNPVLKPLASLAAWNFLSLPNGEFSQEHEYWRRYTDKIFNAN
jgi:hypothetical protein